MTIAEMHNEFKIGMDKIDSLSYPNLLPEEIDVFLNSAQDKIIKQRAYANNFRQLGIEETQKRLDDLKNLVLNYETSTFIQNTSNKPGGAFVNLPTDYLFAIEEEAIIEFTDCNNVTATKRVDVVPVTHDRYNKLKRDPFHKPANSEVHRLGFSRLSGQEAFELLTDISNSINTYYLRYLKTPVAMQYGSQYETPIADVDCELSDHIHREIIAMAVYDALEGIEAPRYPTSKNKFNEIE